MATCLRSWIPSVIQSVEPYVSSEDIEKGRRWNDDVAGKLQDSGFGILCITPESVISPWLLFEAGALSKMVASSRVVPILLNVKKADIDFPLAQFQMVTIEKEDFFKMIKTLNNAISPKLDEVLLARAFERWWPEIATEMADLSNRPSIVSDAARVMDPGGSEVTKLASKIDDILSAFRGLENIISNPEKLFPISYIEYVMSRTRRVGAIGRTSHREFVKIEEPYLTQFLAELSRGLLRLRKKVRRCLSQISSEQVKDTLNALDMLIAETFKQIAGMATAAGENANLSLIHI